MEPALLNRLISVRSSTGPWRLWNCSGIGQRRNNVTPSLCSVDQFEDSKHLAVAMNQLCNFVRAQKPALTVDAIFSRDQWFNKQHVEPSGDNSNSAQPLGKNLVPLCNERWAPVHFGSTDEECQFNAIEWRAASFKMGWKTATIHIWATKSDSIACPCCSLCSDNEGSCCGCWLGSLRYDYMM